LQKDGLPFSAVLPEERIEEVFAEEGAEFAQEADDVYTPSLTLWASLSQVLHKGEQRSCLAAVARVLVLLVTLGREPCAKNSGAYCRARAKMPEVVLQRLTTELSAGCEQAVPKRSLWHSRHGLLVDGTTASMPDTPQNQSEYPQHTAQQPGLGFPIVRLHQCRKTDFCKTQRLGKGDQLVQWTRPQRPTRLIAAQVSSLAEQTAGKRPNRVEPRAVKRRAQPIALLTKPRDEARAEMLRNRAA
jgi:hypothetical protein